MPLRFFLRSITNKWYIKPALDAVLLYKFFQTGAQSGAGP
ncbi:hypothetical protein NBRC111894_570 [Sporolactobacillus inulinus]|uniref:Uncharacterized protein n=1 Tax=Sporolactobacillus inulinus TaxID=2078 RepID=A0A4Y1Z7U7_9BACL|nr:hypothetical protein NBRC111894_570 [Sporolactobacillus inulinus]